jgi:hypothetical protein
MATTLAQPTEHPFPAVEDVVRAYRRICAPQLIPGRPRAETTDRSVKKEAYGGSPSSTAVTVPRHTCGAAAVS